MNWIGYYIEDGVIWFGERYSGSHERDRRCTPVATVTNPKVAEMMIDRLNAFAHLDTPRAEARSDW